MKKWIALLLSLLSALALFTACGAKGQDKVKLVEIKLTDEQYAYAVQKEDSAMLESINAFLAEITTDGTLDTILNKYFGDGTPEGVVSAAANNAKDQLVLVTNAAFAPFEYMEGNKFYGVDIEVAKAFADSRNEELVIRDTAFDSVLLDLDAGYADIAMAGLTINEERKKTVNFSTAYYNASQMLIVRTDDTTFSSCKTAADVEAILNAWDKSKKIGFQNGTTGNFYAQGDADWGFPGFKATCKGYDNGAMAVQDLISGNLDAVVIDEAPAKKLVQSFNR